MTLRQAILSILHLFFVCLCFGAGFFCISLSYLPDLRTRLADIILLRQDLCTEAGIFLFGIAFLLLLGLYALNRGKFLRFVMGRHFLEIKEKVIRETIEGFLKTHPSGLSLVDLEIAGKSNLEMRLGFRSCPKETQVEDLLKVTEKDLTQLLYDRFGYKKGFVISLDAGLLDAPDSIPS